VKSNIKSSLLIKTFDIYTYLYGALEPKRVEWKKMNRENIYHEIKSIKRREKIDTVVFQTSVNEKKNEKQLFLLCLYRKREKIKYSQLYIFIKLYMISSLINFLM